MAAPSASLSVAIASTSGNCATLCTPGVRRSHAEQSPAICCALQYSTAPIAGISLRQKSSSARTSYPSADAECLTRGLPAMAAHSSTATIGSFSFVTDDACTAQAAAAEAVALARAAVKAARAAAEYAQLQRAARNDASASNSANDLLCLDAQLAQEGLGRRSSLEGLLPRIRAPSRVAKGQSGAQQLVDRKQGATAVGRDKVEENVDDCSTRAEGLEEEREELFGHGRDEEDEVGIASVFRKAMEKAEAEAADRSAKSAPLVSFEGLEVSPSRSQVVVRSKRRAERQQRRDRAGDGSHRAEKGWISDVPSTRITGASNSADSQLMNQLGKSRLLTAAEEVELSKGIQDLLKLEKVKVTLEEQLGRAPDRQEWARAVGCLSTELERRLHRGRECKNTMIRSNMRLVYSIAKKYSGRGISLEDLVADGCKGLIRGTEKFDHTKGFKFSTYAHWWIRQAITRAITDQSRTIRLPAHLYETVSRVNKAREMLQEEYGRPPTSDEIAELVGISPQKLVATMRNMRLPVSMETPIGKEGDETLGDVVTDPNPGPSAEDDITNRLLKEDLDNVLYTLNARERDVLRLRYGLDDGCPRTLEEVGTMFRVTRERIRQIETKALRKLRQPSRNKVLREYVAVET